mgnify:CR=1 FL=1
MDGIQLSREIHAFFERDVIESILSLCKTVGKTEERKRLDLDHASTRFLLYSQSQWKEQVYILKIILLKYHMLSYLGFVK